VRSGVGGVAERVDVEEARTGYMGLEILLAADSPARRHVPAAVDDGEARLAEAAVQPLGRNERFHFAKIG
jgi:hypothetical protein